MTSPLVSVIMPVYNAERYIFDSVKSVLDQSYRNIELIIVDDYSSDRSISIVKSFKDERIKILTNSHNEGPGVSCCKALAFSKGQYVCRLDADDIALNCRIERQERFFEENQEYGIVGSNCYYIDESGNSVGERNSKGDHYDLLWKSNFKNPFVASSVMFRSAIAKSNNLSFSSWRGTEDYFMWSNLLDHSKGYIMADKLIKYRINSAGLSATNKAQMSDDTLKISSSIVRKRFPDIARKFNNIEMLVSGVKNRDKKAHNFYNQLLAAFTVKNKEELPNDFHYRYDLYPTLITRFINLLKKSTKSISAVN